MLPKAERVDRSKEKQKLRVWIHGVPMSGKTHCADTAPMPLIINTDGNYKQITAPVISLGDSAEQIGRSTEKVFAKTNYEEIINEILADKTFETIVIDLLDDVYEMYREKSNFDLKVTHESDVKWGKGYEAIRKPFLSMIRNLCNIDKNIIFISHTISEEIEMANGRKSMIYRPNLPQKVQNKICGNVDFVYNACKTDDGYKLRIDNLDIGALSGEGSRFKVKSNEIDNDWNSIVNNIL